MRVNNRWVESIATLPAYLVLIIALYKLKLIIWLIAMPVSLLLLAIAYRVFIIRAVNKGRHPMLGLAQWLGGQLAIIAIVWFIHELLK